MIHITDYRIGNYVWVDRVLRTICLINADDGFEGAPYVGFSGREEHPYESCSSNRIEAAPLSEALLREVGFRADREVRLLPQLAQDSYILELETSDANGPVRRKVQHLHQVQNLYHALRGHELPLGVKVFA